MNFLKMFEKKRALHLLAFVCVSISLVGCKTIPVKDFEYCGDLGKWGAECNHTLKEQPRTMQKPEWDDYRFGQICTASENWQHWKGIIEKFCSDSEKCSYEDKKAARELSQKIDYFTRKQKLWSTYK